MGEPGKCLAGPERTVFGASSTLPPMPAKVGSPPRTAVAPAALNAGLRAASGRSSLSGQAAELDRKRPPPVLLDHLVGAGEEGLLNCQAERLGGREIDYQLELGRLLD